MRKRERVIRLQYIKEVALWLLSHSQRYYFFIADTRQL